MYSCSILLRCQKVSVVVSKGAGQQQHCVADRCRPVIPQLIQLEQCDSSPASLFVSSPPCADGSSTQCRNTSIWQLRSTPFKQAMDYEAPEDDGKVCYQPRVSCFYLYFISWNHENTSLPPRQAPIAKANMRGFTGRFTSASWLRLMRTGICECRDR